MDFQNPNATKSVATSEDAGQASFNPFTFDLANAAYRPAALDTDDRILIGIVPAGERLLTHLCRISVPVIDSDGSPTGTWRIGTTATDNALTGNNNAQTAVTLTGEDFTLSNVIGSATQDTPIYLKFMADVATIAPTGVIYAELASRPWRREADE